MRNKTDTKINSYLSSLFISSLRYRRSSSFPKRNWDQIWKSHIWKSSASLRVREWFLINVTMTVITLAMIILITAVWLQNNQSGSLCDWIDNNLITFFTINEFSTRSLQSIWHAAYLSLLFSITGVIKLKESQFVVCLAFLVFFRFFHFSAHLWIT